MNQPPFLKIFIAVAGCLCLTACDVPSKNYKDTSLLEKPPALDIVAGNEEQSTPSSAASVNKGGFGEAVVMIDSTHLLLKQPLGTAWKTLEAALKQSGFELTDRNLEKGFYYVNYDPETFTGKTEQNWATKIDDFLFPDEKKPQNLYAISMRPKTNAIVIHTLLVDSVKEFGSEKDASAQLLAVLYKTLREGLSPAEPTEQDRPKRRPSHY